MISSFGAFTRVETLGTVMYDSSQGGGWCPYRVNATIRQRNRFSQRGDLRCQHKRVLDNFRINANIDFSTSTPGNLYNREFPRKTLTYGSLETRPNLLPLNAREPMHKTSNIPDHT